MKVIDSLLICVCLFPLVSCGESREAWAPVRNPNLTQQQLEAHPEQLGGTYYAYPGAGQSELTDAPEGYSVVYVSHYGRHGSRYQPNDQRYQAPIEYLEERDSQEGLSQRGQELLSRLRRLWPLVQGHGGELSTIGEEQHRDLAQRLCLRCPELLGTDAFGQRRWVDARASVVPRCGASMRAFCDQLSSQVPALRIAQHVDSADMAYIANDSPALKALDSDTAAWREGYEAFCRVTLHPERLMASLLADSLAVVDSTRIAEYRTFMTQLYWVAVGMQDIPADSISLMEYFTPGELFDLWRTVNYRMYMTCGPCPSNRGIPADCARPLLRHIIDEADAALASDTVAAHLRFGHDSHLLRLLCLVHADGADMAVADSILRWQVWQEPVLSPMAANLQLLFYRSADPAAPTLVKALLNEREWLFHLDVAPLMGPYYDWETLRKAWMELL